MNDHDEHTPGPIACALGVAAFFALGYIGLWAVHVLAIAWEVTA